MVSGRISLESALDNEVRAFRSQTFAPSTKDTYRTHRDTYLAFCKHMGYSPVPATTNTICRYVAMLARTLKFSSVKQYLNIIRLLHLEWNLENPLADNFRLSSVLKGIRRQLGNTVTRKLPILPQQLKVILSHLNVRDPVDGSIWGACLIMFYGLLRRSNVLVTGSRSFDPAKHLRRRDVTFHPWGALISIRWSKTLQFKDRALSITLPRLKNHPLCPVQALYNTFEQTSTAPLDGPALMIHSKHGLVPLTVNCFAARIHSCLQLGGLDPSPFGTHSFRRGGATFAYQVGLSAQDIRLLGDWKSDCYLQYIEPSSDVRYRLVATMQKYL